MSLRSLLSILFITWFILVSAFISTSLFIFWQQLHLTFPVMISFGNVLEPVDVFLTQVGEMLAAFLLLLMLLLFLLLDRLVIQPVKGIGHALKYFAEHTTVETLPPFSQNIKEIQTLIAAFNECTNAVEQVHKRDLDISRVKSDFISTAAHQLRTPLTGIRWALEALQNEPLTEAQQAIVKNAVDKSHDLVAVVGTLLDISSIESGKYKYVFAPTDLDQLVSEVTRDITMLAQKSNVTLFYERKEEAIPQVQADRERIKWVLNNLVENAVRYTPAQGSVRLSLETYDDHVNVLVKDTGIGIPAKDRNNIFERFFRAGNAIAKENQGNGLGLYIARTIATDHKGDLLFEPNRNGVGTTFTLSLPRVTASIAA